MAAAQGAARGWNRIGRGKFAGGPRIKHACMASRLGTRIRHFIFPVAVAALAQTVIAAAPETALIAPVGLAVADGAGVAPAGRAAITVAPVAEVADPEQHAAVGIATKSWMEHQRSAVRHGDCQWRWTAGLQS